MRKRAVVLLVALAMLAVWLASCGGTQGGGSQEGTQEGTQQGGETEGSGSSGSSGDSSGASNEVRLPEQITLTTYDVGSAGYSQLTAIADAITRTYGTRIRLMPSASGIGRLLPLRDGTAQIGGRVADEVYFAFEGIHEFATPQWGPQNVRYIFPILNHFGAMVLADSKFQTIADLKGAKVPWVVGNPSVNIKTEALLASVGLTLDDVQVVEVTSYGKQPEFVVQGQLDVAVIVPDAASVYEAHELHGIRWLDLSYLQEDPEALERLRAVYPFGLPEPWDIGAGLTRGQPVVFLAHTSYAPAVYADADPDLVYNWLRALEETYDLYKDATPNMFVWHYEKAVPEPLGVPLHEGAIRYFKEKGMWSEEYDRKNQELIQRYEQLRAAWEETVEEATAQGIGEADFAQFWMERRPK